MKKWVVSMILISILSACSAAPKPLITLTPPPYDRNLYVLINSAEAPNSIEYTNHGIFGPERNYQACVMINQGPLWEPGLESQDIQSIIRRTISVWIDGQPIKLEWQNIQSGGTALSNGLGSFGDTRICVPILKPSTGLHTGKIEFESPQGEKLAYEWTFFIVAAATPTPIST